MNKENLIEYAKVKGIEINENDSFNNIFKQVTGKYIYEKCYNFFF